MKSGMMLLVAFGIAVALWILPDLPAVLGIGFSRYQ
jgi:hypothetical protein